MQKPNIIKKVAKSCLLVNRYYLFRKIRKITLDDMVIKV